MLTGVGEWIIISTKWNEVEESGEPHRFRSIHTMFIGEYAHTLDDKARIAIPAKFRKKFVRGVVVTRGLDNCLFVYPMQEWAKLADKLAALPISQSNSRAFSRLMLAGAIDLDLDKQGRVVIPEYLRSYAKLGKRVVITGLYNRLELWSDKSWKSYKQSTESRSGSIAEKLGELGI